MEKKLSALVVDDNNEIIEPCKKVLSQLKIFGSIVHAKDGLEAFQKAKMQSFDLLITDAKIPKREGAKLIDDLSIKNENHTKFILITGSLSEEEIKKLVKMGINNIIIKPFTEEKLEVLIKKILNIKS